MYTNVSEEFMQKITSYSRTFRAKLVFENFEITDEIFSVKVQGGMNLDTALTLGTTTSVTAEIDILANGRNYKNKRFQLVIGLKLDNGDYEYIPYGYYVVLEAVRKEQKITLSCADLMSVTDKIFNSSLNYPNTGENVINEICKKYNFTHNITGLEDVVIPFRPPVKTTARELIGAIASLAGYNAIFDREGVLNFRWYSDEGARTTTDYIDNPFINEEDFSVNYLMYQISSKVSDVYGDSKSRTGISIKNEYVLKGKQNGVWERIKGFAYRPVDLQQLLGNILIDAWDIITIEANGEEITTIPMSIDLNYDGGVSVSITATAPDTDKEYKSPAELQAEKQAEKDENLQLVLTTSNASAITLTTTDQLLCDLDFSVSADALPYVMATVQLSEVTAEVVTMTLMINSQVIQIFNLNAVDGYNLATFVQAFLALSQGTHNLQLYIRSGGAGKVEAQRGQIVLTGSGLSANAGWNGLLSLDDIYNIIIAKKRTVTFLDFNAECSVELLTPIPIAVSDSYSVLIAKKRQVSVTELVDTLPYRVLNAYNDGYNTIYVEYSNPIYFGGVIDVANAKVTGYRAGVPEVIEVLAVGLENPPQPSILSELTFADGKFTASATLAAETEYTVTFLRTFSEVNIKGLQNYTIGQLEFQTARQLESVPYVCTLTNGETVTEIDGYYTFTAAETTAKIEITAEQEIDKDCFVIRLEEGAGSYYQYSNRVAISTASLEGLDTEITYSVTDSNITSPITGEIIQVQGSFALVTATAESEE